MINKGSKYINAVDSIIADAIATGQDIHGLSAKDQEDISCLYLEVSISLEKILFLAYLLNLCWNLESV